MIRKIALFGSTGLLGKPVTHALHEAGFVLTALVRNCQIVLRIITTICLILSVAFSCKQKEVTQPDPDETDYEETDSTATDLKDAFELQDDWDYQSLYGIYLHESNTKGFTAILEILPDGNDLTFSLSVKQSGCNGQADGVIGMAIHTKTEYAGFFDNPECRMEFLFNLTQQSVRLEEVGFCRLHERGCNFNGVYIKKQ